jgi:LysR family glycine cleavage system transcriptional activator
MATWNRNVSMRALRAFLAAAERMSFRLAADDLFLTASAVSHQIKQLEDTLGARLFTRHPRSLELTARGSALADELRPLLENLDRVIEQHGKQSSRAELRLSVQPFFASELLVPRLAAFLAENAGISIAVDTADDETRGHDRSADVAIRLHSSPPADVANERLFALRLIPVGSPAFYDSIKVVAGRITSEFPLLVHEARRKAWQQWQRSSGIRLPRQATTIRLNSMVSIARAAEEGLGAALMPAQLCSTWIESGSLVPLFEHELASDEAYYLTYDADHSNAAHLETFRKWVLREFALDC